MGVLTMRKNSAAYMTAVQKIEIRDCAMPKPGLGEVLLKMAYVGVCGSDAHFFESGKRKGEDIPLPFILGHEASAVVAEVGEGVLHLAPGDRVVVEPQQTCGVCEFCRSGHYNMCPEVAFPSVPPHDGMLRKYMTFPAHLCYRLPEEVSMLEGALIEPLAVGLSAAERGDVTLGQTVVILGIGAIGLTTLLACKARGAAKIIAVDLYQNRLDCARSFGADYALNAAETDTVKEVMRLTGGAGADVVFETAGSQRTAAQTVDYLKRCGTIVLVGNVNGETPVRFMDLMYKEGEIKTVYRYKNNFKAAVSAIASGSIRVKDMVSDVFSLDRTQEAFETSLRNKMSVIKIVVDLAGENTKE